MKVIQVTVSETPSRGRNRMNRHWHPAGQMMRSKAQPADAAEAVRRVLNRQPLPAGQQALLMALYSAGDAGLTASELAARLQRNETQLNRLLARLARRIRRTSDATILQRPGLTLLLNITPDAGEWRYTLRRAARRALNAQYPGGAADRDPVEA